MTNNTRSIARRLSVGAAVVLALLVPGTTLAVSTAWTRQLGTKVEDTAGGIAADSGGVTIVGTTQGNLARTLRGFSDAFIRRYDRSGRVLWTRQFGTDGQDWAIDVAADAGGITVLGATDGSFTGDPAGSKDLFVRRYDRSGKVLWTRQLGTPKDEEPGAIAADGSGVIVVGTTRGALTGSNEEDDADAFVRRYDRSGKVVFTLQFGTSEMDTADAVTIDSAGFTDAYLRRFDPAGKGIWTRQWGQEGDDQVLSASADGSGITAVGYTHADAYGIESSQAFIRRYDRAGKVVFSKVFGTADSEIAWGVASDTVGLTVTGYTYGSLDGKNQGTFDVFVRRYSRSGSLVWRRQFGTKGADLGFDVAADAKGFTILGHTNGSLGGDAKGELDVFVRRFLR